MSGDINQVTEFENTFLQFAENLKNEELDFQVEMSEERIKEVEIVLKDKNLTKSAKKIDSSNILEPKVHVKKLFYTYYWWNS